LSKQVGLRVACRCPIAQFGALAFAFDKPGDPHGLQFAMGGGKVDLSRSRERTHAARAAIAPNEPEQLAFCAPGDEVVKHVDWLSQKEIIPSPTN
jgi:hypothetical protein